MDGLLVSTLAFVGGVIVGEVLKPLSRWGKKNN